MFLNATIYTIILDEDEQPFLGEMANRNHIYEARVKNEPID